MEKHFGTDPARGFRLHRLNIILVLSVFGCSGTTVVKRGENFFLEEPGVLVTKGGKTQNVRHALVRDDSIFVLDSRLGQKTGMPADEAEKLVVKKRGQGALQGMFLFAGLGAVLGAIPDPDCGDPCLFPNGGVEGSFFWAALAAPVGALWGAILGGHREYVFEQPATVSDTNSRGDGKKGWLARPN